MATPVASTAAGQGEGVKIWMLQKIRPSDKIGGDPKLSVIAIDKLTVP
jgi:hypothetical protein